MRETGRRRIDFVLLLILALNAAFWAGTHDIYAKWAGVPPVPSKRGALMLALGDPEFSYRSGSLALQNLGDGGGEVTPLKNYDYKKLDKWFRLLNDLDPASEHLPMIAGFYFGAVQDRPASTRVVVDFLAEVGQNPAGQKWRWLAQAAFLSRHVLHDMPLALDLAYRLKKMQPLDGRPLPAWARELPAFILQAQGDKAAAKQIIESMLLDSAKEAPEEVNFMKGYLVEQLGVPAAEVDALLKRKR